MTHTLAADAGEAGSDNMQRVTSPTPQALVPIHGNLGENLFCPACGYNLRGTQSARCPECGLAVDRAMPASRIPWVHRRTIGRWRAYWRTSWLVMSHPARIAGEMGRPVSLSDARRFRHLTVLLGFVPLAAWSYWLAEHELHFSISLVPPFDLGWILDYVAIATAAFSLWLFVLMVSGAASYFFHPRALPVARQNRAVALSYYACAPLAWLFVPATILLGALLPFEEIGGFRHNVVAWCVVMAGAAALFILLSFWIGTLRLLRYATGCGPTRVIALAVYLPIACAMLLAVCCAITAGVALICFVVLSYRP